MINGVDGREVCRFLKENSMTSHIIVVLITAALLNDEIKNCVPEAIVSKPFEIEVLEDLVDRLLLERTLP